MRSASLFSSAATIAEKLDYNSFHDRERREISQLFDKNSGAIYCTWMQRKLFTLVTEFCDNNEEELHHTRSAGMTVGDPPNTGTLALHYC